MGNITTSSTKYELSEYICTVALFGTLYGHIASENLVHFIYENFESPYMILFLPVRSLSSKSWNPVTGIA
jgi:hypothetical protein